MVQALLFLFFLFKVCWEKKKKNTNISIFSTTSTYLKQTFVCFFSFFFYEPFPYTTMPLGVSDCSYHYPLSLYHQSHSPKDEVTAVGSNLYGGILVRLRCHLSCFDSPKVFKSFQKDCGQSWLGQVLRGWKGLIKPSGESLISLLCHATVPDGRSHANRC